MCVFIYIDINGFEYNTGFTLKINKWTSLLFSWDLIIDNDPERGYVYKFTIKVDSNEKEVTYENGFKYGKFKTSIGRRYNKRTKVIKENTYDEFTDPLLGLIEMLFYSNNYTSSYYYENTLKSKLKVTTFNKQYDAFDLIKKDSITEEGVEKLSNYYTYKKNNDKLIPLIEYQSVDTKNIKETIKYTYNDLNNINGIYKNNIQTNLFTYDKDNRISNDYNYKANRRCNYVYDNNGNIKTIVVSKTDNTNKVQYEYNYDSFYKDKLTSFGVSGSLKEIRYDNNYVGNPIFYGIGDQGISFSWKRRRLEEYKDNTKNLKIIYSYNDEGLRVKKSIENEVLLIIIMKVID